ncbi:hypothetical protein PCE1_000618 [Barthelona sp. PCE]
MKDKKPQRSEVLHAANEILQSVVSNDFEVEKLEDVTPSYFICILEHLYHKKVTDVIRRPLSDEDAIHNAQALLNYLANDVLNLRASAFSHISPESIVFYSHPQFYTSIVHLLEVFYFLTLQRPITKQVQTLPEKPISTNVDRTRIEESLEIDAIRQRNSALESDIERLQKQLIAKDEMIRQREDHVVIVPSVSPTKREPDPELEPEFVAKSTKTKSKKKKKVPKKKQIIKYKTPKKPVRRQNKRSNEDRRRRIAQRNKKLLKRVKNDKKKLTFDNDEPEEEFDDLISKLVNHGINDELKQLPRFLTEQELTLLVSLCTDTSLKDTIDTNDIRKLRKKKAGLLRSIRDIIMLLERRIISEKEKRQEMHMFLTEKDHEVKRNGSLFESKSKKIVDSLKNLYTDVSNGKQEKANLKDMLNGLFDNMLKEQDSADRDRVILNRQIERKQRDFLRDRRNQLTNLANTLSSQHRKEYAEVSRQKLEEMEELLKEDRDITNVFNEDLEHVLSMCFNRINDIENHIGVLRQDRIRNKRIEKVMKSFISKRKRK